MANCHNCERLVICPWASAEEIICSSFKPKPQTNADRIRAMTDEELADLFADNDCGYCRIHDFCFAKGSAINCEDVWLDWLKQEVSDEGT